MVNCIPENTPDPTCMSNDTSTKIFEDYVEKIIYISWGKAVIKIK